MDPNLTQNTLTQFVDAATLQQVGQSGILMPHQYVQPFDYNWPLKDAALQVTESLLQEDECKNEEGAFVFTKHVDYCYVDPRNQQKVLKPANPYIERQMNLTKIRENILKGTSSAYDRGKSCPYTTESFERDILLVFSNGKKMPYNDLGRQERVYAMCDSLLRKLCDRWIKLKTVVCREKNLSEPGPFPSPDFEVSSAEMSSMYSQFGQQNMNNMLYSQTVQPTYTSNLSIDQMQQHQQMYAQSVLPGAPLDQQSIFVSELSTIPPPPPPENDLQQVLENGTERISISEESGRSGDEPSSAVSEQQIPSDFVYTDPQQICSEELSRKRDLSEISIAANIIENSVEAATNQNSIKFGENSSNISNPSNSVTVSDSQIGKNEDIYSSKVRKFGENSDVKA